MVKSCNIFPSDFLDHNLYKKLHSFQLKWHRILLIDLANFAEILTATMLLEHFAVVWTCLVLSKQCNLYFHTGSSSFQLVSPGSGLLSGFCTSDGRIENIFMRVNFFWYSCWFAHKFFPFGPGSGFLFGFRFLYYRCLY